MKEKHKYHFWDYINLVIFYSVFLCFLVSLIIFDRRLAFGYFEIIGAGGGEAVEERSRFDVGQITRVKTKSER